MTTSNVVIRLGKVKESCFVIMPFSGTHQSLYERVIRPAVAEAGLECVRADEVFTKPQITHDIWKEIREARVVIAELTGKNANVLYELGLAHALGKPTITITRSEDDVPFDLRALRYIHYNTDEPFWGEHLRDSIKQQIEKLSNEGGFSPVFDGIDCIDEQVMTRGSDNPTASAKADNLTGSWFSSFSSQRVNYDWRVFLFQWGTGLTGRIICTYNGQEKLIVVDETIAGEVKDGHVSFRGTAAEFLQEEDLIGYYLDRFEGRVSYDGNTIFGKTMDANDTPEQGETLALRRV